VTTFYLNKTGYSVGNYLSNTVLNNLQLTPDFASLLTLDNRPHEEINRNERGCMDKINFKRRNLHSTRPSHQKHECRSEQITNIQNENLDKLTKITQNHENKLNGIQEKMVEHENKLNQLEEEKAQLRNEMVQKTNLINFQLDRQEQYIRRENILTYGVEEDKEDDDDGEKVLFKIADELEIDLEDCDIHRVHIGKNKKEETRRIHAQSLQDLCHAKKETSFLPTQRTSKLSMVDSTSSFVSISYLYGTSY